MKPAKSTAAHAHAVIEPHKSALLKRLNRIGGQVRGVAAMIEQDRYCIDILTQITAIQSALDAAALQLLKDHTRGCVQSAIKSGHGETTIAELMRAIARFTH